MSQDVSCHVMHYRSSIDACDQPVVFSLPSQGAGSSSLPTIVYLHDRLDPPTRDRFMDVALREAHRWLPTLRDASEPVCLVQPMLRVNGEAIGLGGRDLAEALAALAQEIQRPVGPLYLAGVGAGATRALLLACWFPERWRGVALAGPVVDERLDGWANTQEFPWEELAKESLRPASLIDNLADLPLYIEHPWWFDGLQSTTSVRQFDRLRALLSAEKFTVTYRQHRPILLGSTDWPTSPAELLEWFLHLPSAKASSTSLVAYSPRAEGRGVRLRRAAQHGKPATIKRRDKEDVVSIQTSGCAEILVERTDERPIRLDRRRYSVPRDSLLSMEGRWWACFQHRGDRWQLVSGTEAAEGIPMAGPMMDLRWDGVMFVPGTLGDDFETRTLRRLAETLQHRWTQGTDAPLTGGASVVRYDIVADTDVTDEWMQHRHVVVLGTPRTNLLLARYSGRLGCEWPAAESVGDSTMDPIRFRDHLYRTTDVGLILLDLHPDHPSRYWVTVTATSINEFDRASRYRLTLLPDFVLWQGNNVPSFGYRPGA